MHPRMFRAYRRLLDPDFTGSVLEVGATPSANTLLSLLPKAKRTGLNLDGPHEFDGFEILKGNANLMPLEDNSFDLVLCNAVIEHDPKFWLTLSEIRRVTKPGGRIVIGAPGYRQSLSDKVQGGLKRYLPARLRNPLLTSTIVYQVHNEPGDYYRFSEQAFREVIMDGLENVTVTSVMLPPRLIGSGVKPRA